MSIFNEDLDQLSSLLGRLHDSRHVGLPADGDDLAKAMIDRDRVFSGIVKIFNNTGYKRPRHRFSTEVQELIFILKDLKVLESMEQMPQVQLLIDEIKSYLNGTITIVKSDDELDLSNNLIAQPSGSCVDVPSDDIQDYQSKLELANARRFQSGGVPKDRHDIDISSDGLCSEDRVIDPDVKRGLFARFKH